MSTNIYYDDINIKDTLIIVLSKLLSNHNPISYKLLINYINNLGININPNNINPSLEFNITNQIINLITQKTSLQLINNTNDILDNNKLIEYNNEIKNNKIKNIPDITDTINTTNTLVKLGNGGFGSVYKYYNNIDDTFYAIKQITLKNSKCYKKYFNEVQIMSKLNHKNIIKYNSCWLSNSNNIDNIDDIDNIDNTNSTNSTDNSNEIDIIQNIRDVPILNIQMELCLLNLNEYLLKRNDHILNYNYKLSDAYHISKEIIDGIEYLHENNIIHGDISTQNVFITHNFGIKIGDFGLSHNIISDNLINISNNKYDKFDTIIDISNNYGNPIYRAPEILKYKICKASDIYSFGIIIFELFNCFKTCHQRNILINKLKTKQITDKDIISTIILDSNLISVFNYKLPLSNGFIYHDKKHLKEINTINTINTTEITESIKSYLKLVKLMTHEKYYKRPSSCQIKYELLDLLIFKI